jgi:hypothetical protein
MRLFFFLLFTLFLGSCSDVNPDSQSSVSPAAEELNATEKLNQWLDGQYENELSFSPEKRSRLGDKTDYDQLSD